MYLSFHILMSFFQCISSSTFQDGTAPLWMAAQMGQTEAVKVLLLRGADRDADRQVCRYFRVMKAKDVQHVGLGMLQSQNG